MKFRCRSVFSRQWPTAATPAMLTIVMTICASTPSAFASSPDRLSNPSPPSRCGDGRCQFKAGEDSTTCPVDCSSLGDRIRTLTESLRRAAFAVDEGVFKIFEPEDCASLPRCWANNPTTPYGFFLLPRAPGEPDPDPEHIGPTLGELRSTWRLLPNEAIVFIGTTPPPSPYFSFTAYVFSRYSADLSGAPPYDDRVEVFASLGDSINSETIRTRPVPDTGPFNKEMVLIITADQGTDRNIRDELALAGFPDSMVSTLILPRFQVDGVTPLARTGYANEDDLFGMLLRVAHLDAQVPGSDISKWLDAPGGRVFRVRPRGNQLDPFAFPLLRPEGTGEAESPTALQALTRALMDQFPDGCATLHIASPSVKEDGYFCLDHLVHCYGDCRDTPYMGGQFKLGAVPQAIIVAGVNHELTGKAAYVNITVTRLENIVAFYSVVMRDLVGSADNFIPNEPDRDSVWQVKLARQCNGEPFCFEVSEEQVPLDAWVIVVVRAYMEPATATSAKSMPYRQSEIVFPRMIKVTCEP